MLVAWTLASLLIGDYPSPQAPPANPPAIAAQPSALAPQPQAQPQPVTATAAIPAGQPVTVTLASTPIVLHQAAPTVYVVPPAQPASVVVLQPAPQPASVSVVQPASYQVLAAPASAAAPAQTQTQTQTQLVAVVAGDPGPLARARERCAAKLAGLHWPRLRRQAPVSAPVAGLVTLTPQAQATPQAPAPARPLPNSAGLLEPASKRPPAP